MEIFLNVFAEFCQNIMPGLCARQCKSADRSQNFRFQKFFVCVKKFRMAYQKASYNACLFIVSAKNSEFVSAELKRSVTCTIEGFCVWAGISRSIFYDTYAADARFSDIVTRMREECEVDARMKFELGAIDTKLAPLWMSRHGYSARTESAAPGEGGVQIVDDL